MSLPWKFRIIHVVDSDRLVPNFDPLRDLQQFLNYNMKKKGKEKEKHFIRLLRRLKQIILEKCFAQCLEN